MTTPPPLDNETPKAYAALQCYCEMGDNRSISKAARQLSKSRQLVVRWASKYTWKARIARQRQRECEEKIAATTKAIETTAQVTEEERSALARKAFDVARRFVDRAAEIVDEHPVSAVRLLAVGAEVASAVGGAANNYAVPPVSIQVISEYVDASGKPTQEMNEEEMLALLDKADEKPPELPCDNWNPDSIDATPLPPESERAPKPEPTPVITERTVPARMDMVPTNDSKPRSLGHLDVSPKPPLPRYKRLPFESNVGSDFEQPTTSD